MSDLQDKMIALNVDMFKAMLKIKEIPDVLAERYFMIKTMIDRVNGRLSPVDLAMMALDVGYNPKTGKFDALEIPEKIAETPLTDPIGSIPQPKPLNPPAFEINQRVEVVLKDEIVDGDVLDCAEKDGLYRYTVKLDNDDIVSDVVEDDIEEKE